MTPFEKLRADAARVAQYRINRAAFTREQKVASEVAEEIAEAILALPLPTTPDDVADLVGRLREYANDCKPVADGSRHPVFLLETAADTIERLSSERDYEAECRRQLSDDLAFLKHADKDEILAMKHENERLAAQVAELTEELASAEQTIVTYQDEAQYGQCP